jgi:tetratricopeptide (TPR) repeat protein
MNSPAPSYRAFISYSHKDSGFARWLHRKLEGYTLPKPLQLATSGKNTRHPLRPIFLDREELASAASLSDSIVQALKASAALIVVCSPAAAASRWVNEEIRHFRKQFPDRPVFAIVAHGDPGADPRIKPGLAALPLNLLLANVDEPEGSLGEPLAVDVRREADGKQGAFLKLVAGLLAIPYSQLRRRELRRRNQVRSISFGISLLLTVTFALLAWRATVARNEARMARAQAELELQSERQTRQFLLSVFQLADPGEARGEAVTVREVLDTAVARIDSTEFSRPLVKSRFLATMGQAYSSLGMNRRSVELLRQSLDQLGIEDLSAESQGQRIDSQLELADVLFDMGEYDAALASVDAATQDPSANQVQPLQMAYAQNIRGDVLAYQQQDEAAMAAYREALQYLDQATASREQDASSRSRSLGGMAVLQHFAGEYEQSMAGYAAVVGLLVPILGEQHPDTIWAMISWGSTAYSAGETEIARQAWMRSLVIAQKVLGESHPEVGTIKNNLGRLLLESGDYPEAERYLRDALAIDRTHRSEHFDDLAFTLNNLAMVRMAQDDPAEAEVLLEEARTIAETGQHRILGPVLTSLADLHCQAGDFAVGLVLSEQSLAITARDYGDEDWRTQRAVLTAHWCGRLGGQGHDAGMVQHALAAITQRWSDTSYFSQRAHQQSAQVLAP